MKTTAIELRALVIDNDLTVGRLDKETLGTSDYKELTSLYSNALDALTLWASKDYKHTSTTGEPDSAFNAVKAILALFATDENRIIIDQTAMRTMRDLATKPRRMYSAEYKKAYKAYKNAHNTLIERYADLLTLGVPERNENESTQDYKKRIIESGVNVMSGTINMLDMYLAAEGVLLVKDKAVEDIKAAGNWTWKRPVAVSLGEFAELVENYIADCLMDGYNLKPSKQVRDEKAKAREEAKAEKAKITATTEDTKAETTTTDETTNA
jgi:hypothetical protein